MRGSQVGLSVVVSECACDLTQDSNGMGTASLSLSIFACFPGKCTHSVAKPPCQFSHSRSFRPLQTDRDRISQVLSIDSLIVKDLSNCESGGDSDYQEFLLFGFPKNFVDTSDGCLGIAKTRFNEVEFDLNPPQVLHIPRF